MALQVWLPLNGNLNNQGLARNINATTIGTVSYDNNGKIGKCFISGGTSQTVNGINLNSNLVDVLNSSEGSSIALWVKPTGTHVHYNGTFISSGNWNGSCWSFGVSQDNSQVDILCKGYNTYISCSVPVNQWTHLVCVYKNGTSKLYKNGIYVGQQTGKSAFASDASNTCIGRETYADGHFGFNGRLNDIRIYDHALSPKEVKELSKGLVLHYKLDNILHNKIYDSSGYNNNGTISGTLTLDDDSPRYDKSMVFSNSTNYITSNGIPKGVSVSYWFKPDSISNNLIFVCDSSKYIGAKNSSNIYNNGSGTSSKLYIDGIEQTSSVSGNAIYFNSTLQSGWHHYCFTNIDLSSWTIFKIGNYGSSWPINGQISDVRIYATVLSADDIKDLYNTPTFIDNQGDILTGEIVEESPTERELYPLPINVNSSITIDGYKVSGHTFASSDYIPINPSGKTYYYDVEYSNTSGNHLYIGFERYDANKASGSNSECQYVVDTTSVANHVRVTGTINLSTANGNTAAFTRLRILNDWNNTGNSTYIGTIHYISLKEVSSVQASTNITKNGLFIGNTFINSKESSISQTGNVIGNQFIEI